jgi:hypothetical protein
VVPAIYKVFTAPDSQATIFNWTYLACNWWYSNTSMRVILQTLSQMQRTSSSLRYVNCGPSHKQSTYSSAYSDFNIHLNVSALLLYISRQFNERYTANFEPNTAYILQFTLIELWSRLYTKYLQLRIFSLQYSSGRICAAIVHITTIQWALYCIPGAKYRAHSPVYALWTVVPDIYKVFTVPHIYASISSCTHLRCYSRYHMTSVRVILQTWCQLQRTSSGLRYANCGSGHTLCIYSSAYSDFDIHLNVSDAAIGDISTIQWASYCKLWAKYSAYPTVYAKWTVVPAIYKIFTAPHT